MFSTLLLTIVRWFPVVAVTLLALVFLRRRLWRELPFFFLYLGSVLLLVAVAFVAIKAGKKVYFYTYWISDLLASTIVFLPMYEVFLRRLFKTFYKTRLYKNIFPIVAGLILFLTVVTALQAHDKGAAFHMASRAFDFMRTAVLIFFIGLMAFMGRQWTRYDLGITLGFGIQAAVALAAAAVRTKMHYQPTFMDTAEAVAYNVSCVIWIVTFWRPEQPAASIPEEQIDPQMLEEARSWETALKEKVLPRKRNGGL